MFNETELLSSESSKKALLYSLRTPAAKIGRFCEISDITELAILLASSEFVLYQEYEHYSIYKTTDIGYGYCNIISKTKFLTWLGYGKINKEADVYLDYKFGNIFPYVYDRDIDEVMLRTNETYVLVCKQGKLFSIVIGEPTIGNFLHYQEQLDGLVIKPHHLLKSSRINSITIKQWVEDESWIYI